MRLALLSPPQAHQEPREQLFIIYIYSPTIPAKINGNCYVNPGIDLSMHKKANQCHIN
jgi:hypothetical protein